MKTCFELASRYVNVCFGRMGRTEVASVGRDSLVKEIASQYTQAELEGMLVSLDEQLSSKGVLDVE